MEFVGKYPHEVLVCSTYPKRSNRVLGAPISLIFHPCIVLAQASDLRPKYPESLISMSVVSSIDQLQSDKSQPSHYFLMAKLCQLRFYDQLDLYDTMRQPNILLDLTQGTPTPTNVTLT